jgi:hypothetical protein
MDVTIHLEETNFTFVLKLALLHGISAEELLTNILNNKIEEVRYANPQLHQLTILD